MFFNTLNDNLTKRIVLCNICYNLQFVINDCMAHLTIIGAVKFCKIAVVLFLHER